MFCLKRQAVDKSITVTDTLRNRTHNSDKDTSELPHRFHVGQQSLLVTALLDILTRSRSTRPQQMHGNDLVLLTNLLQY